MKLKIQPLEDRIIVEPLEPDKKSPGGILLPEIAQRKPQRGTVLAVGPGKRQDDGTRMSMDVAVGDEVIYTIYAGSDVEIEGETYKILSEHDILGKIV